MQWVKRHIFIDTGASAAGFVFTKFAKNHNLLMIKFIHLCILKLVDDNLAQIVIHYTHLHFRLGDHYNELWYLVTIFEKLDLILEMLWLEQYDPKVSFCTKTLTFNSGYYTAHCLSQGKASIVYSCLSIRINKDISF